MTKQEKIDEKVKQLVDQEVYCTATWCMTDLIRYAEENPRDSAIDINEYWSSMNVCPECSCSNYSDFKEYKEDNPDFDIEEYNKKHPYHKIDPDSDYDYICDDCGTVFNEPEMAEVFEYYFVSDWIAGKLKEVGEIVLTQPWVSIWCRCATGQSITQDYCWQKIAKDIVERWDKQEQSA